MGIPLLASWFVCALGAAVFAAVMPWSRGTAALGVTAFALGAWWAQQPFAPAPGAIGISAAVMAAVQLVRPPRGSYVAGMAGLLAGLWTGVLEQEGLPPAVAVVIAASVPSASAWLGMRRPAFAPAVLREEALLFMIVLALAAAAAPGIADGWHAAVNLSAKGGQNVDAGATSALPAWTLALASAAVVSGGFFSVWSRR